MPDLVESTFRRLLRAPRPEKAGWARALLEAEVPWPRWLQVFNVVHVESPEAEAEAAHALATAATRRRRREEAARFRLLEGRALQRSASPHRAAAALARAAKELAAVGDAERARQAHVLRVDALAVSGRIEEALRLADEIAPGLRGPRAAAWSAALAINRANALRLRGDLDEATRSYERAARRLDRLGDAHTAAIARANAGTARMDAGDSQGAVRRFQSAVEAFEALGQPDLALEMRENLAAAQVRAGQLGDGLRQLDQLAAEHADRGLRRREALCRMDLADAYLRAGDRSAAEREATRAARAFQQEGAHAERVEALWVAARTSRPRTARRHLARAARAATRAERPGLGLRCEILGLDFALQRGELPDGARLQRLGRAARRLGLEEAEADVHLLAAHAALARGRPGLARRHLADRRLLGPGRPWVRAAAQTALALAEAQEGHAPAALRRLERVGAELDRVRASLPGSWLRATFLLERLDPYLARVDLLLDRGEARDRMKAEALLDALAARRFHERSAPAGGSSLASLRRRLDALYDRLARGSGPTRGLVASERERLVRLASRLEGRVADAWRTAERRGGLDASVRAAAPVRSTWPAGATVVHVWARNGILRGLTRSGDRVTEPVSLGSLEQWDAEIGRLRLHGARVSSGGDPRALGVALARLADRLLGPLGADRWRARVRLVLDPAVPDLPWELLPFEGGLLAGRRHLLRVPARSVRPRRGPRGDGLAVLALGERDLPAVERERAALPADEVWAGAEATRARVRRALLTRATVHLAGHGYAAAEAPLLGGVRVADGWFSALDVPRAVASRLVVLAACRTGREAGASGEAWGGLPRALLAAGARYVLWTADDVADDETASFMERFHAEHGRGDTPTAFGRALAAVAAAQGDVASLLPFRLSGISP